MQLEHLADLKGHDYVYVAQGDMTMLDGEEYLAEVTWSIFTVLDD